MILIWLCCPRTTFRYITFVMTLLQLVVRVINPVLSMLVSLKILKGTKNAPSKNESRKIPSRV